MRRAAVALAVCALAACGGDEDSTERPAGRLERLGFFDYTPRRARAEAAAEVRDDPATGVFSPRTRRLYFADSEDLTEGFADDFLREVAPVLRQMGVPKLRIREDFNVGGRYALTVNGRRYLLYSAKELNTTDHFWGLTAARTVALVNDLLERAGSTERAYGYAHPASNDFSVFLLTPELRDELATFLEPRDQPFVVTDEPPDFGYSGEGFGVGEPGSVG